MLGSDDYRRAILEELRAAGFRVLSDEIEQHLGAGKREAVKAVKRKAGTLEFTSVDPSVATKLRDKLSKLDIRISEFSDTEQREIVLKALHRQFIEPRQLIAPVLDELQRIGVDGVVFVSPVDEAERIGVSDYEKLFMSGDARVLEAQISEELSEAQL